MQNTSILQGRLVKEPELAKCGANKDVSRLRFAIACERSYAAKGQERKTDFIDCVAWRSTAEFIDKYFGKGDLILIRGSILTDVVEKDDGQKRKYTQVNVEEVNFCGSKKDSAGARDNSTAAPAAAGGATDGGDVFIDDDEDMPF